MSKCMNSEQKAILISFIEKHPELRSAKCTSYFTTKQAQKLWQDIMCRTKARNAAIKKDTTGTTGGGKATVKPLTSFEETIISMLRKTVVDGHTKTIESCVPKIVEVIENVDGFEAEDADFVDMGYVSEFDELLDSDSVNTPSRVTLSEKDGIAEPEVIASSKHAQHAEPSKRMSAASRTDSSIKLSEDLLYLTEKNMKNKAAHYTQKSQYMTALLKEKANENQLREQKLQLYKREVEAKEKMARALLGVNKSFRTATGAIWPLEASVDP